MEPVIDVTEIKQAHAKIQLCDQKGSDSQSPTPVGSQSGNDYAPLPPNIPDGRMLPHMIEHTIAPPEVRKFANPAPLGLCAFALTSFMSNIMNVHMGLSTAAQNVASGLIYGGTAQFLAGMWEMALGNTFGATSFCSYGAYWITFGVISDLEGTNTLSTSATPVCQKETLMGLFLLAWFIFTTLMLLCTLKSSLAMFLLFFFLDMNYLLLGIANMKCDSQGNIAVTTQRLGGYFGLLAAFTAWYNAFAGIFDKSNGFFTVPLGHFPWSPAVRAHAHQAKFKEV
ncbi:hypothetical protein N7462_002021 [Penicillium macrosclerotiorum]|uniref:uncharacterized protein n=1 Tax=Penicillium macrosclerotiorum TaxID=303699 RepID=UPI002549920F|nr:uncharacterized protein N7462_002021 [Penicillium macrosclerotiorum]KAJ5692598.1 hypothetical protein N7462_002021 [Penicillium macrosclerotiorum]